MSAAQLVFEKLKELPEATPIALEVTVETYVDAIRGVADLFANDKDLNVIYISATIPSSNIMSIFELLEIDLSRIYFIDCISHIMMSTGERSDHILYVESPTMLENIMLKAEFLLKKHINKKSVVILDSVNSLAIHNDLKIQSEFLHIFVTNLRAKGAYMIVISMKEQQSPETNTMLNLICDEIFPMN